MRKFKKERSCTSKKEFRTYKAAEENLKQLRRYGDDIRGLGIYTCNYCHWFHIGHLSKNRRNYVQTII